MPTIFNFALGRNTDLSEEAAIISEFRQEARNQAAALVTLAEDCCSRDEAVSFKEFETTLRTALFALGEFW